MIDRILSLFFLSAILLGEAGGLMARPDGTADAVVALDGSGQYTSVQAAISAAPMGRDPAARPWVILVKPGVYRERVYVQRERGDMLLLGEDAARTVITFDLNAGMPGPDGKPIGTFRTPTMQIDADGFSAANLTFANSSGPVGQALALRVDGDRVAFEKCRFLGWQDTILVNRGRQVFWDCYIEGHVDFIFGAATAYFDHCNIYCLRKGYITAASTPAGAAHGMVFSDCRITGADGVKTYLGRPWRNYAQVVFLRTSMSSVVRPEGWFDWNKPEAHKTVFYGEFASTGPGADASARVPWARQLTAPEAGALTLQRVVGGSDGWNPMPGILAAIDATCRPPEREAGRDGNRAIPNK
jgi:pectinesterase